MNYNILKLVVKFLSNSSFEKFLKNELELQRDQNEKVFKFQFGHVVEGWPPRKNISIRNKLAQFTINKVKNHLES